MDGVGETIGVEEEFHVVDPVSGEFRAGAKALLRALPDAEHELHHSMIETATEICDDLTDLRSDLVRRRGQLVAAGRAQGLAIAASGTLPNSGTWTSAVYPDERFDWLATEYGQVVAEHQLCACQVHVSVPDRDLAVRVSHRVQPWLPVLLALSASSPMFRDGDTGYASYRTVALSRWPTVGPPPVLDSAKEYDDAVASLVDSGIIADAGMIYYDARPSARYPTVEVRIADACADLDDVILLAALSRALVVTAAAADVAGEPAPVPTNTLQRAANWRAARSGLDGLILHPQTNRPAPVWTVVEDLLDHVRPALVRFGDEDTAETLLRRLRQRGNGAQRQRALAPEGPAAIVAAIVAETAAA